MCDKVRPWYLEVSRKKSYRKLFLSRSVPSALERKKDFLIFPARNMLSSLFRHVVIIFAESQADPRIVNPNRSYFAR